MSLLYPITYYKTLNNSNLQSLVLDPNFTENRNIEFKAQFYSGNKSAKELKKDFSAFANTNGGLIFFGLDDEKNIAGIDSPEIRAQISQKLGLLQIKWDIINTIPINSGRNVFIAQIEEEYFYWKKPITVDGIAWFRDNATCKEVQNVSDYFKYDKFLPSDIKYFEYLCDKDSSFLEYLSYGHHLSLPFYYVRIFMEFEIFLSESIKKASDVVIKQQTEDLLNKYKRFSQSINIDRRLSVQENLAETATDSLSNGVVNDLQEIIHDFKEIYE